MQRKTTLALSTIPAPPPYTAIQSAASKIDIIYSKIAEEARQFLLERPQIAGLTADAASQRQAQKKSATHESADKLALVYSLLGK